MMQGTRMFGPATARPSRGADLSGRHTVALRVLTIVNGFTVTGESACAAPENFNRELPTTRNH